MSAAFPDKLCISFVVPAHNEERELPATLRAITLAAGNLAHEIVVVDDASTDATAAIARKFGARVLSIDRRQIAAARNAGARAARSETLIFVDADTRIAVEHVNGVRTALAEGCIGGGARIDIKEKIPPWAVVYLRVFTAIYFRLNLGAGAFLFTTRAAFEAMGGFDEKYFAGEEVFFSRALCQRGRFKILATPAITSGRKLRLFSGGELFRTTVTLALGGPRLLLSRRELALWYNGAREPVLKP